jgi:hypothetical protein
VHLLVVGAVNRTLLALLDYVLDAIGDYVARQKIGLDRDQIELLLAGFRADLEKDVLHRTGDIRHLIRSLGETARQEARE